MPGSLTKAALTVFTWLLLSSFFRSWKHWALGKKHLWRQGIFYPYLQHAQSVLEDKRLQTNHWTLSFSSRHKVITFRGPWLWNPGCLCFLHVSLAAEQWALCCKANCNGHMIPAQNQAGHYQWGTISEEQHDFSFISGGKGLCPQSSAQLQKARSGTQPSRAGQLGTSGTGNCSGWSWFWIHLGSQSQIMAMLKKKSWASYQPGFLQLLLN